MQQVTPGPTTPRGATGAVILSVCALLAVGLGSASVHWNLLWSDPNSAAATLNIGVLVFREGLECVLVLASIAAGTADICHLYQQALAVGAGVGFAATLLTWRIAVRILFDLNESISALALQAASGLLAVVVLLIVMNWFFHKVYWTGWISLHNKRKRRLLEGARMEQTPQAGLFWGMSLLGFTSVYREGFEVVLFLQGYRLRLGQGIVLRGACLGLFLTGIVAVLTFWADRKLPYRKMLVLTGVLLGIVLFVMVGEQAQEMQLAHWIPTTPIPSLASIIPSWMALWLSIFPTVETLLAQAAAAFLVLGSYVAANRITTRNNRPGVELDEQRVAANELSKERR